MFTVRNTVVVALMQVGIIVAGVLASGFGHRVSVLNQMPMFLPTALLYNYGVFWFAIPTIWSLTAVTICNRTEFSEDLKQLVFSLGIVLVVLLAFFVLYADLRPLLVWDTGPLQGE